MSGFAGSTWPSSSSTTWRWSSTANGRSSAHLDDADVCPPTGLPRAGVVDRNLVADAMRHLTAQVLNLLYDHRCGPAAAQWGDQFDDVRDAGRRRARIPDSASWARWFEVDELAAG
jgi:hypothetical protein